MHERLLSYNVGREARFYLQLRDRDLSLQGSWHLKGIVFKTRLNKRRYFNCFPLNSEDENQRKMSGSFKNENKRLQKFHVTTSLHIEKCSKSAWNCFDIKMSIQVNRVRLFRTAASQKFILLNLKKTPTFLHGWQNYINIS